MEMWNAADARKHADRAEVDVDGRQAGRESGRAKCGEANHAAQ